MKTIELPANDGGTVTIFLFAIAAVKDYIIQGAVSPDTCYVHFPGGSDIVKLSRGEVVDRIRMLVAAIGDEKD